ncbi:MAG: peptide chain release factor 2 [Caldisericia bacterium]|nr:peptide chain release factor 2 [Caldisericia bacterium]
MSLREWTEIQEMLWKEKLICLIYLQKKKDTKFLLIEWEKQRSFFDAKGVNKRLVELENIVSEQSFWSKQSTENTSILKEHEQIKRLLRSVDNIEEELIEIQTNIELIEMEPEEISFVNDLKKLIKDVDLRIKDIEIRSFLNGKYDSFDCFLSLSSGAGGVDAMDWTEIVFNMYISYFKKKKFQYTILSVSYGSEAGMKSATIQVKGDYAYGFLKSEKGVHRLVRISPFDANHRRHTSFTMVEIIPVLNESSVKIDNKDLRIDTFNASGHGGQNVQKNDTAVRIVHIPTGITANCQSERSQMQNKAYAMQILFSKLITQVEENRLEEIDDLRLKGISAEWGNQIRSYVMQPYTMVKDARTNYETANVTGILEGNLDDMIWEYIGLKSL